MTDRVAVPAGPLEAEVKLVIASDRANAIASEIAQLSNLPGFALLPGLEQLIEDAYYDSSERALSSKGWALRVRRSQGTTLVALKGPTTEGPSGVPIRRELESTWSPASASELARSLDQLGVGSNVGWPRDAAEPEELLETLDLQILTRRSTRRLVKMAVPEGRTREMAVASLDIDEVSDLVEGDEVLHHEIEIEATDSRYASSVARIVASLKSVFDSSLRPFPHSKLAIGLALQTLRGRGVLSTVVDANGSLTEEGFSIIENELAKSTVSGPRSHRVARPRR